MRSLAALFFFFTIIVVIVWCCCAKINFCFSLSFCFCFEVGKIGQGIIDISVNELCPHVNDASKNSGDKYMDDNVMVNALQVVATRLGLIRTSLIC